MFHYENMSAGSSEVEEKKVQVNEKITIKEREYTDKLIDCSQSATWAGARGFIGGALLIPFILKRLKFIPTTIEVRAGTGLILAVFIGTYSAKTTKENCARKLIETYKYVPYQP